MDELFELLKSRLGKRGVKVVSGLSFAELTTFGCGGKVKLTAYPTTVRQLVYTVKLLDKLKVNYVLLGKGSNVLASDNDYDGVAVVTAGITNVQIRGTTVYALAGTSTLSLAHALQIAGLTGGEFFACLPATVGGAVVGNAGCFGQDVGKIVHGVEILHRGRRKWLKNSKCHFGKRNSVFKNGDYVVLAARFKLARSTPDVVKSNIEQMRHRKAASQPLNYRSAGCVFYHDTVSISRLIDQAGLKGYRVGGAMVSTKHAGFVLNVDKATAKDIYLVTQHVAETIWQRYGIRAKLEIRLINFEENR